MRHRYRILVIGGGICMLQAKSNKGDLITLASLPMSEIEIHREQSQFYCPTCQEPVIIKAGTRVIPHFAHRSKVNCPSYEGGEGAYHEKGKLLLYQWLKSQGLNVALEVYLTEIKQQPDILLVINKKQIAIEFQCARIGIVDVQQRNEGYRKAGITPIWILGANRFKRQGSNSLKVDQFTQQFMHQFSTIHPLKLIYFCPDTLQLTLFQDIYLTRIGQALGKILFSKLTDLKFIDLFRQDSYSRRELFELWKREKKRFRLQYRKHLFGKEHAWHQWLYLKQTHLEYLPSIINLPVSHQFKMKSPLWDWQSRIVLNILDPLPIGSQFTLKRCEHELRGHLHYPNYFPLVRSTENPINQYLQLLEELKYIKQVTLTNYIKTSSIKHYEHIELSLEQDEQTLNKLILINTNKIQA